MRQFTLTLLACILILPLSCSTSEDISSDEGAPLVVYSGRSFALVDPLLRQFEQETGIQLDIRYNSTPPLATQVLAEGDYTPADVLFFQDPGYLGLLAEAELLSPLSEQVLDQVDPRFRDPDGLWLGASGRLRVIVYDPNKFSPSELPERLEDLADPQYQGAVGAAFTTPGLQAHVTALRHLWGEDATAKWLKALKDNGIRSYATSPQLVQAVANGEIMLGWTNHYYLYRLKQANPNLNAENYIFPAQGRDGNLMFTSGLAITKYSKRKQQAEQLVEYLISEKAQAFLRCEVFEYQTRKDFLVTDETCRKFGYEVPKQQDVSKMLPDINQTKLADIDQAELADVQPTVIDLQKLSLL